MVSCSILSDQMCIGKSVWWHTEHEPIGNGKPWMANVKLWYDLRANSGEYS